MSLVPCTTLGACLNQIQTASVRFALFFFTNLRTKKTSFHCQKKVVEILLILQPDFPIQKSIILFF